MAPTDPLEPDEPEMRAFNTMRGAFTGDERDEPIYFAYSATLRIFGCAPGLAPHDGTDETIVPLDFAEIETQLGVTATKRVRAGELRRDGQLERADRWFYDAPVHETLPLADHIDLLWHDIRGGAAYLRDLKERVVVSVFLGYRSNSDMAGVELPHTSLEMFVELGIPFELSIIVT